jgi:hypothetical protein
VVGEKVKEARQRWYTYVKRRKRSGQKLRNWRMIGGCVKRDVTWCTWQGTKTVEIKSPSSQPRVSLGPLLGRKKDKD